MINSSSATSAEEVNKLVVIERWHISWFYPNQPKGFSGECRGCYFDPGFPKDHHYPCPTLLSARSNASEETLVAVALILDGERSPSDEKREESQEYCFTDIGNLRLYDIREIL